MNNETINMQVYPKIKNILDRNMYYKSEYFENLNFNQNFKSKISYLINKKTPVINQINKYEETNKKLYFLLKFFYLNKELPKKDINNFLSELDRKILFKNKIIGKQNGKYLSNYRIVSYNKKYFFTEKMNKKHDQNHVYTGLDTYLLLEKLKEETKKQSKLKIFEIGTGPGIISICMVNKAKEIIACDINNRAIRYAQMNRLINIPMSNNIKFVHKDYKSIFKNTNFDLVICNPPFIPVPNKMKNTFPIYGYGGNDGLDFIRELIYNFYNSKSKKIVIFTASGGKKQAKIFEILGKYNLKITADLVLEIGKYTFIANSHIPKKEYAIYLENFEKNECDRFYYYNFVIEKGDKRISVNNKCKSSKLSDFLTEKYSKYIMDKSIRSLKS